MATPLAHSLAGYGLYAFAAPASPQSAWKLALLCVAMANAPDLDFVPGILVGTPALFHQGVSHSLGVALVVSFAGAAALRPPGVSFARTFSLSFVSYLSHLALDVFGPDSRPPYGQPLLWPLTGEHFISPLQIFWGVRHAASTSASTLEWIAGVIAPANLGALALEVLLLGPLAFLAERRRRHSRGARIAP